MTFSKSVDATAHDAVRPFIEAYHVWQEDSALDEPNFPGDVAAAPIEITLPAERERRDERAPHGEQRAEASLVVRLAEAGEKEDDLTNTVAYFRGARMVVQYRGLRRLAISADTYHAMLICETAKAGYEADEALERFLRAAEPPEHDRWDSTANLKKAYKQGYKKALDELDAEVRRQLRRLVKEKVRGGAQGPDLFRKKFPIGDTGGGSSERSFVDLRDLVAWVESDGTMRFEGRLRARSISRRALPYCFDDEELDLNITNVVIGNAPVENRIRPDKRIVELQDQHDWSEGEVHLEARMHENAASRLVPEDEQNAPPWRIDAVLFCREAKWRGVLSLEQENGVWRGTLPLEREELRGTLSIRAFLVRTRDRTHPQPGFAGKAGARLASSEDWKIYADDPQTPPGEHLDIEWIDFADLNKDSVEDTTRHVYYLDFSEAPPKLYLNENIAELKAALDSRARRGLPAAVRDVLFDSIAQITWMALAMNAVLSARDGNSEEVSLDDWQANVLKKFENRLCPRFDDITQAVRNPNDVQALLEALTSAVQGKVEMRKSTDKLLRLLTSE